MSSPSLIYGPRSSPIIKSSGGASGSSPLLPRAISNYGGYGQQVPIPIYSSANSIGSTSSRSSPGGKK